MELYKYMRECLDDIGQSHVTKAVTQRDGQRPHHQFTICHSFLLNFNAGDSPFSDMEVIDFPGLNINGGTGRMDEKVGGSPNAAEFAAHGAPTRLQVEHFLKSKDPYDVATFAWMEYLYTDPIFAPCFDFVSVADALYRGVRVNMEAESFIAMTALISLRHPYEHPNHVLAWYKLVHEHGLHPRVAHMLSAIVDTRQDTFELGKNEQGHQYFSRTEMTPEVIRNFRDCEYGPVNRPLTNGYDEVNSWWTRDFKVNLSDRDELFGRIESKGESYTKKVRMFNGDCKNVEAFRFLTLDSICSAIAETAKEYGL